MKEYLLLDAKNKILGRFCSQVAKKALLGYNIVVINVNKKTNIIKYHSKFPIINLPLMTNSATFVINGCERIIVSQIIRSPGVYFEKNKNQKGSNFRMVH